MAEGESEIRPRNRISRGQTLSVTKRSTILRYKGHFNVSDAKEVTGHFDMQNFTLPRLSVAILIIQGK